MRTAAAAATAVALAAAASTSEASSSISVTAAALPYALSTRGGASFQDNDKTTFQPDKGKKRRKKAKKTEEPSREGKESTEPAEKEAEQQEAESSATPSPQEVLIEQLLKEDDYYAILGVSKSATAQEIQKAYRRRAVQTHPDKLPSNDRRAFDKVAEAYDVLSDDTKRATYNRFGKRGLDSTAEGRPPSSFTEDIFRSFFGTNPYSRQQQPRNRTVQYQLEVTLEELYSGTEKNVIVTEPGRKKVQVNIERGMASGHSIVLSGEMDHVKDATPADLVFVLQQRPHPIFTRKGHDLAMELTISLQEAICGLTRSIRHLDGRVIFISSARHVFSDTLDTAMLIQTGDVHVLKGEGMPKPGERDSFGDLYVQYRVEMPTQEAVNSLTNDEREQLGTLLGKLDGNLDKAGNKDKNVRLMQKASPADFGRASGPFRMEGNEETDRRYRQFHFSSGNPFAFRGFGGRTDFDGDDANVQCQQM